MARHLSQSFKKLLVLARGSYSLRFPAPACANAADPIAVRYTEGLIHGFLVLRTPAGETLADGDLIQVAHGERVTTRLIFHFKDGSVRDETAVYSQHRNFRLLSAHLIQKGPAFPHPMEVSIDASTGRVTVHTTGDDGKEEVLTERLKMPQMWPTVWFLRS